MYVIRLQKNTTQHTQHIYAAMNIFTLHFSYLNNTAVAFIYIKMQFFDSFILFSLFFTAKMAQTIEKHKRIFF